MGAKGVQAWLPSMARCLTRLEVFLVVLVDMDVLTRCKVVMADLQALVDTLLMVKPETTEDTSLDASSNSKWASGQPFDTRMFCQFGILSLSVILRILSDRRHKQQTQGGFRLLHHLLNSGLVT